MSERKVLNKYFPPDFDPSKVPRMRKPKDRQEQIRLMAPFSMRCNSCGEYIYAGKKFNGRKETVQGETYYGIKIFRFYIKCPVCSSEITFKTDPKNADYTVEHGVSRNYEPWREGKDEEDKEDKNADPLAHLIEEEGLGGSDDEDEDPMKALEKRQQEAKREMEVMDALQDIRTRNARIDRMNPDDILQSRVDKGKERETTEQQRIEQEEDEALVRKYFSRDLASAKPVDKADGESDDASEVRSLAGHAGNLKSGSERTIKRARPYGLHDDKDDLDREPDVMTLLKSRQDQLPPDSSTFTSSSSSAVKAGPNKRKKGTSAFGVVRKKVA